MIVRMRGVLSVFFLCSIVVLIAGCETPKCLYRDISRMPQKICEGASGTKNIIMRMDAWFRETFW